MEVTEYTVEPLHELKEVFNNEIKPTHRCLHESVILAPRRPFMYRRIPVQREKEDLSPAGGGEPGLRQPRMQHCITS